MKNRLNQFSRLSKKIGSSANIMQKDVGSIFKIGRKMLSATSLNSQLNDHYKNLGILATKALKNSELNWNDPFAKNLYEEINQLQIAIEKLEQEVQELKSSSN